MLSQLYKSNLTLLTDLYQLTMAYGYWKNALHLQESVFHLFFRTNPFKGHYAIAAGLHVVLEWIENCHFTDADIDYLRSLNGNDGSPLFEEGFLTYLQNMSFDVTIDAIDEGNIAFAHEPLLRITGPIIPCQLLETALLTCINFQTLIATKASRVCAAAQGDTVLEFGLRRAQGFDGGISATRAAFIGGVNATSNVLAAKLLDIPVKGTHAHAWVMMFDTEIAAFEAYAKAMPNNCVFLVDTYDSIQGVKNAIQMGKVLRDQGHEMMGIRLDSGDLATLSIQARELLNDAGFENVKIVASDSLNEYTIQSLKANGAKIDIWGVGTNLVTAQDQPALGGVYKLAALRSPEAATWQPKIKLSNTAIKVSNPGQLQVRRFYDGQGHLLFDVLYDIEMGCGTEFVEMDGHAITTPDFVDSKDLLHRWMFKGQRLRSSPSLSDMQNQAQYSLQTLPEHRGIPTYLDANLWRLKKRLMDSHQVPNKS